jgi:hypothetical protein
LTRRRRRRRASSATTIDAGLLAPETVLINTADDVEARARADGRIEFDGTAYDSPSGGERRCAWRKR